MRVSGDVQIHSPTWFMALYQLVQMHLGALKRVIELRHIVEQKTRARGVRLYHQRLVFKLIEVLLDIFVAGFWFRLERGKRTRQGDFLAFAL